MIGSVASLVGTVIGAGTSIYGATQQSQLLSEAAQEQAASALGVGTDVAGSFMGANDDPALTTPATGLFLPQPGALLQAPAPQRDYSWIVLGVLGLAAVGTVVYLWKSR